MVHRSSRLDVNVPFSVKCPAGHLLRGQRQHRHQVIRCPECEADVFVLPLSPFASDQAKARRIRGTSWLWPVVIAAATLAVVVSAVLVLLGALRTKPEDSPDVQAHLSASEHALEAGRLHAAAQELTKARQLALQWPDALSPAELRVLNQQLRETSLLADLLSESLEEILERAAHLPEEEWKAQFEKRYRGPQAANAVVFDAEVQQIGLRRYRLDWELFAGQEPARVEIDELQMFEGLPLQEPRRLLFGARLGSIQREQNGVWVVRFEPHSGVLLTDPRAVSIRYPGPVDDEIKNLLERQRRWTEGK